MALAILLECAGTLLIVYGVVQVFRDIFHPTKSGSLSDWIGRFYSKLLRKTRFRPTVGPLALVSVIVAWIILLTTGFGLIYCGVLPQGFADTEPMRHPHSGLRTVVRAIYVSVGAFDTFETFNLSPQTEVLRVVVAVEGLVGFTMITASVSWTVLVYPALARSRWFARHASLVLRTEQRTGLSAVRELGAPMLIEFSRQVLEYRIDLVLFPILLNFYAEDEASTVPHMLPEMMRFSREATADPRAEIRMAGTKLQIALEDLAQTIASRVLQMQTDDPGETFHAFREREKD